MYDGGFIVHKVGGLCGSQSAKCESLFFNFCFFVLFSFAVCDLVGGKGQELLSLVLPPNSSRRRSVFLLWLQARMKVAKHTFVYRLILKQCGVNGLGKLLHHCEFDHLMGG